MAKAVPQGDVVGMAIISVLIPAILLIGALIYVAFYSTGYTLFQQIVIVVITLIIVGVAEALLWMVWAARNGQMRWPQPK